MCYVGDLNCVSCVEIADTFANTHLSPTSLYSVPAVVRYTNVAWNSDVY